MSVKGKFMLATMVMLAAAMFIYPYASAQIAIEPVCKTCFPNDCYSYKDCKPLEGYSCKTGTCCQGTCTTVNASTDAKVNFIGDQLVEVMKKMESVTGFVDKPSMTMHGTEYLAGDPATIFVQLADSQGIAVSNGNCYIDIYYPLSNGTHAYNIIDAPMINAGHDDGIYYYDLTAPSQIGVYMLSAKCSYSYGFVWIFPASESVLSASRVAVTGTWTGAEESLNDPEDGIYDKCDTSNNCVANYTFNISSYGTIVNITNVNLYWLGESTKATTLTFSCWNGTGFENLANTIALVATGSTTQPSGIDQLQTNTVPFRCLRSNNSTAIIRLTENQGTTHAFYNNWFSLAFLSSGGTIQAIKGSGEMHVSANNTLTASTVWNYPNRTLTDYNQTLMWSLMSANNQSLYNFISLVNQSIYSKLNSMESNIRGDISASNASLSNQMVQIRSDINSLSSLVQSINASDYNSLNDIKSRLDRNYNKVIDVFTQLNLTNSSIMTKLYSMQTDLNNIYNLNLQINGTVGGITNANLTPILNFLTTLNQTMLTQFNNTNNVVYAVNSSIQAKIDSVLSGITSLNNNLNSVNQSIYNRFGQTDNLILSVNSSLYNKIVSLQGDVNTVYNEVLGVSSQVNAVNQSIMNKLYSMQNDLANIYSVNLQINGSISSISVNLTPVLNFLTLMNNTMISEFTEVKNNQLSINTSVHSALSGISADLADLYSLTLQANATTTEIRTRIEEINASTMNYLYGIKGDLTSVLNDIQSVYNLVDDTNTSIQIRLDSISSDISDLGTQINEVNISIYNKIETMTTDIVNQLANISNLNINITANLEGVANDVWSLFFKRGTPPLAPSTQYYCEANNSNVLDKNITYAFVNADGSTDYFSKVEQVQCGFGCVNGSFIEGHAACDYDPTTKGIVALAVVLAIGVTLYFVIKHTGGDEQ